MRRLEKVFGTREAVFAEFPFLRNYDDQLAGREPDILPDDTADDWWENALLEWEKNCRAELPLRRLRENFYFSFSHLILLFTDRSGRRRRTVRRGFEFLNETSDEKRPTFGLINGWQRESVENISAFSLTGMLRDAGLIRFGNTENPRSEQTLEVSVLLWDVLRGEKEFGANDWFIFTENSELLPLDEIILSGELREQISVLPALINRGDIQTVIVRGANRNSRKTVLGAIAASLGLNLLEIKNPELKDGERWKTISTLAVLLKAMPVFRFDVAPGETVEFPAISKLVKAVGITLGKQGGIGGDSDGKIDYADARSARRKRTARSIGRNVWMNTDELEEISERFRLCRRKYSPRRRARRFIFRAGKPKKYHSFRYSKSGTGAESSGTRHVGDVSRTARKPDWDFLAVRDETMSDLRQLEERCRIRENLKNYVGAGLRGQLQAGVRALFNGTSGTGKTYAARLLAGALQKDLYRLDLSTVVNKYIGETEKNLAKIFSFVEELDVILLLDEGDALLTQRTNVGSANDRYANLETNYLLQRLESFEGILIVTTNAADRIDSAFQRRMDTVVEFAAPGREERRHIWHLHLPEKNTIQANRFEQIIEQCKLTGGQIRNIALHAVSLALAEKKSLKTEHLESAVRREYRKIGAVCPLREASECNFDEDRW